MNFSTIKSTVARDVSNLPGWTTKRKIVVIESDDWGSIRMPSKKAFDKLMQDGLSLEDGSKRYNHNDTLADKNDLSALFEVLTKFKDKNNRHAVFTPVSLVANPDFKKIRESGFQEYYYESFTETLKRYYGDDTAFKLWKEGIAQDIFVPQFHAREHLNVLEWMRALQQHDRETLLAFDEGLWGFNNKKIGDSSISFQAAFDLHFTSDLTFQANAIKEGLDLFEKLFGYRACFFVPPNGPFNNNLEKVAAASGIKYMSTPKIQVEPIGLGKTRRVFHWLGKKNQNGQLYLTRNCFFEPGEEGKDWVDSCLNNIASAFRWNKPAIISSHRVNYIGALNIANRDNGLKQLSQLLDGITKKWPDAEFCTSEEIGNIIAASKK